MGMLEWLGLRAPKAEQGETRGMSQIWPPLISEPRTLTRQIFDGSTAAGIPAIGKALGLYGLIGGLDLQAWRSSTQLPTPRLLQQPDVEEHGSTWFVQQHLNDWLLHGNACHLVTARDATGAAAAVRWFPAHMWTVTQGPLGEDRTYYLSGRKIPREDVVHVKRGHDPAAWGARGVGIVQQHLATLDRAALQEAAETGALQSGGMPSVAVIAPQQNLTQEEMDEAGDAWHEGFGGPVRRPGIFPKGTEIIPLSWSATDAEMVEARKMSLIDVANVCNLDPYWLGSPGSSHNYKSPGPMFLVLLRTAFEPVLSLFEDAWSDAWLPRGQRVRFDRDELTRDDMESTVNMLAKATKGEQLLTLEEARIYMGRDPNVTMPARAVTPALQQQTTEDDPSDDEQDDNERDAA